MTSTSCSYRLVPIDKNDCQLVFSYLMSTLTYDSRDHLFYDVHLVFIPSCRWTCLVPTHKNVLLARIYLDGPDTSLRPPLGNLLLRLALAGIALLTLGALIQATITEVTDFMAGKFSVPSIALIIVGSIVFIVAFYGCCGAIRESSCMVTTYVIFLMVILVIEIAIAAVAFIYKDDFEDVFTDAVTKAVNNYYVDSGSRTSMDALQVTLECCGVTGPDDYPGDLPTTCCLVNNDIPCKHGKHESLVAYQDGCVTKLQHFISYSGDMLGGVAIGVSAVTVSPDHLLRGVRLGSFSYTVRFT
uniref:Tetraspanin n=1 Tax=Timema poppense TaxID=170557 RepID=A0A7R9HF93_TIMPO|nr:unnamed protein product [Timema poppensis]